MTLEGTRSAGSVSGRLAGAGTDVLRAVVLTRAVPAQPPADLAELVSPVYDRDSHLLDWRFAPHRPDSPAGTEEFNAYRRWRSEFAAERFLGERALVIAFLDWLAPRMPCRALDVLRLAEAHVDFHAALEMRLQIDQARKTVNQSDEHGFGLFAAGRRSASRALIPTEPATVLLATGETVLSVDPAGLRLQQSAADSGGLLLESWTAGEDGVRVRSAGEGEVDLGTGAAARLVLAAGRHAPAVEVRRCPLTTLLAPLLVFLRDATELAGSTSSSLHLRSGWS